jgi:Xaa-Pro aminopeptidase
LLEPGVYIPSILGIRLENVYVITRSKVPQYTLLHPTLVKQRKFLKLETLDYIPFQRRLIEDGLLNNHELDALRKYHEQCIQRITRHCGTDLGRDWLYREAQEWLVDDNSFGILQD